MKRHEDWRAAYRADRYLKDATIGALERRSKDIASNMLSVNGAGQLTPGDFKSSEFWWISWTHILEELSIRQVPYGSVKLIAPGQFPWVSYPEQPRGLRILGKTKLRSGELVRMGQREYIKEALNLGRFRIAPAASYADASLNPAIQDDELSVTAVGSGETATIQMIDPITGAPGEHISAIGEITYSRSLQENFYVICMTADYAPRLLDDFEADALLIIRNVNRFITRMEKAVKRQHPALRMAAGLVQYYDPYRIRPDDLDPFFAKNFKYSYQKEYRFVWHQPGLPLNCEPFFVEIGSLRDIASIHVLRDVS